MADAMLACLASWGLLVGSWVVIAAIWVGMWWMSRRDLRRWDERLAADRRRWALQQQLWEMEDQIRTERLSEAEREWQRRYREEQAEIRREARRRLGLPEEEADG